MPRSKRWPYNSGLHVPLIVSFPEKFRHLAPEGYTAGGVSTEGDGGENAPQPPAESRARMRNVTTCEGGSLARTRVIPPCYDLLRGSRPRRPERFR